MYQADVKETDSSLPPRCPRCGADGLLVEPDTLQARVQRYSMRQKQKG
jgi:hypothetical protein